MVCWLLIMIGWVGGAGLLFVNYQAYRSSLPLVSGSSSPSSTSPHAPAGVTATGGPVIVNGANESRSIVCDGNDVTVNGSDNRIDITGHCLTLTVSGSGNEVSVDVADAITANGLDNLVTFRAGSPHIESGGISNVVRPG
jgi:DUF3060 family protein